MYVHLKAERNKRALKTKRTKWTKKKNTKIQKDRKNGIYTIYNGRYKWFFEVISFQMHEIQWKYTCAGRRRRHVGHHFIIIIIYKWIWIYIYTLHWLVFWVHVTKFEPSEITHTNTIAQKWWQKEKEEKTKWNKKASKDDMKVNETVCNINCELPLHFDFHVERRLLLMSILLKFVFFFFFFFPSHYWAHSVVWVLWFFQFQWWPQCRLKNCVCAHV